MKEAHDKESIEAGEGGNGTAGGTERAGVADANCTSGVHGIGAPNTDRYHTPASGGTKADYVLVTQAVTCNAALDLLIAKYRKAIVEFCRKRLGNHHDADDVTQETCFCVFRMRERLDPSRSFVGLLYWIAHCRCNEFLRKVYRKREHMHRYVEYMAARADTEPIPEHYTAPTVLDELMESLDELPSADKMVLIMHHVEKRTYESMGAVLGGSVGTMWNRVHRAEVLLARNMAEKGIRPLRFQRWA